MLNEQKNWCFWTVVLRKTLESPLDCKEIQPVHSKGDLPWDFFAVQGTLKSLLQYHNSKASILWCSAFFIVPLSHPYMTTGKIIALTKQTFVGKVMSLLFNMLSKKTDCSTDPQWVHYIGAPQSAPWGQGCHVHLIQSSTQQRAWHMVNSGKMSQQIEWTCYYANFRIGKTYIDVGRCQGIQLYESENEIVQSCPTLCNPMDYSPPGSSIHDIFQANGLPFPSPAIWKASSYQRVRLHVYC